MGTKEEKYKLIKPFNPLDKKNLGESVAEFMLSAPVEEIPPKASNLSLEDFHCRYLVVDDIWIPLAESLLIEMFSPLWNLVIDGFGNHAPGAGRYNQQKSPWDVLHPGRAWAEKLLKNRVDLEKIRAKVKESVISCKY